MSGYMPPEGNAAEEKPEGDEEQRTASLEGGKGLVNPLMAGGVNVNPQEIIKWPVPEGEIIVRSRMSPRRLALIGMVLSRERAIRGGKPGPASADASYSFAASAGANGWATETYLEALRAAAQPASSANEEKRKDRPWWQLW